MSVKVSVLRLDLFWVFLYTQLLPLCKSRPPRACIKIIFWTLKSNFHKISYNPFLELGNAKSDQCKVKGSIIMQPPNEMFIPNLITPAQTYRYKAIIPPEKLKLNKADASFFIYIRCMCWWCDGDVATKISDHSIWYCGGPGTPGKLSFSYTQLVSLQG